VKEAVAPKVPTISGTLPADIRKSAFWNGLGCSPADDRYAHCCQNHPPSPQTPKDLVELLTKAAVDMSKDPKFLSMAEKLNPGAPRLTGENLLVAFRLGVSARPEVVGFMKTVLTKKIWHSFRLVNCGNAVSDAGRVFPRNQVHHGDTEDTEGNFLMIQSRLGGTGS